MVPESVFPADSPCPQLRPARTRPANSIVSFLSSSSEPILWITSAPSAGRTESLHALRGQQLPVNPARSTSGYPRRIACLTEETTETLYLLGEQDRIAGVSGYTARPPEARLKPRISAFTTAKFEKIMAVEPDLVLAFSDLQADIVRELISRGVTVFTFNQRSIEEIFDMILLLARI